MTERERKRRQLRRFLHAAATLSGLGIHMAATALVCVWLGQRADACLGTAPLGVAAGCLLGLPLAAYSVYRRLRDFRA